MKLLHSIPALLYVLVIVLLPHAHGAAHSHDCGSDHCDESGHSIQASCQLCELPALIARPCHTDVAAESILISGTASAAPAREPGSLPPVLHQARAPPTPNA